MRASRGSTALRIPPQRAAAAVAEERQRTRWCPCLDQYVQRRPFNQYRVPDIGGERVDAFVLPDPDDRQDDRRTLGGQRGRFGHEEPASVIAATMSQHHPPRDRLRHR
jgi:hypothetical protein